LTTEGSFTFGLAASSVLTIAGHPLLGLVGALAAGAVAGIVTGFLQTKLDIHPVLAGILTMSGLYSINLFVMGGASNLTLLNSVTIFNLVQGISPTWTKDTVKLVVAVIAVVLVTVILTVFFKTSIGLSIRATGDNADMVRASSINVDAVKMISLAISNACVALCGGLIAQYQSFADINSGVGILVVGLASVIIGEAFFGRRSLKIGFISAVAGSIVYRYIIAIATKSNIFPAYMLKLISAVIVAVALAVPTIKIRLANRKLRKNGMAAARGGK
jgi:putative ABC transport system permease protein